MIILISIEGKKVLSQNEAWNFGVVGVARQLSSSTYLDWWREGMGKEGYNVYDLFFK